MRALAMGSLQRSYISRLLEACDIRLDGTRPFDITIHNEKVFDRVLTAGTLGLGETYMDGFWDASALDQTIYKLLVNDIKSRMPLDLALVWSALRGKLLNLQRLRAFEVGLKHYDIGNDIYEAMLDSRLVYSCGYWRSATSLEAAQEAKLDLICRKIGLEPGMRVLDIGSGWGGLLKFAAERYGVTGLGITVSQEQAAYANAHRDGLPIETRLQDYMSLDGKFDRIVSVGMFEHVGAKNYSAYMRKVSSLLCEDGMFLLHTIGGNITQSNGDPWSEKYIFPNGMLPSQRQVATASEGVFVMEDWHNFGADYDRTLMAWCANFDAAWPQLSKSYDERFRRMWRYYLLSFAATFRARYAQLWQIVYTKSGLSGGYASLR
jgi:cyclopropane-fatty-acyl-phospholipid synthase